MSTEPQITRVMKRGTWEWYCRVCLNMPGRYGYPDAAAAGDAARTHAHQWHPVIDWSEAFGNA